MQRDREHAEAKRPRPFEQLMRGVIETILRIIQGMDMEIGLDPFRRLDGFAASHH